MLKNKIKVSNDFKTSTIKATFSIVLFAFVYLLLIGLTVLFTIICIFVGIKIITYLPRIHTILLGVGLASIGIFILIFLLKFIFKKHVNDRSNLFEIQKKDEPEFFQLIQEVVEKTGSNFPKKIYLSNEVNAAVFYDSSILSMFLPIKKNLVIGMGLINTVTKNELKAILAHEFGHFSQRTMKIGSYVYTVNHIIYNLIYENESFDKIVEKWVSISRYFSFFVIVAFKLITLIQWVLKIMYEIVNKNYYSLSREMEFHADEIAANAFGGKLLSCSLLRLDLSLYSLNSVITFYENKSDKKIISENFYVEQFFVMNFTAKINNLKIENNLPVVTLVELNKFNLSKLNIEDQWASHPSLEQRITRLEEINPLAEDYNSELANNIFKDKSKIQRKLTQEYFKDILIDQVNKLSIEDFKMDYKEDHLNNNIPELYNGYYDNKYPSAFEIKNYDFSETEIHLSQLFSDEMVMKVNYFLTLESDYYTIKQISEKNIKIKSFDYDGIKYKKRNSKELLTKISNEIKTLKEEILENDIKIYFYFKDLEEKQNVSFELDSLYLSFFEFDKDYEELIYLYENFINKLSFISEPLSIEKIVKNFEDIVPIEAQFKKNLRKILDKKSKIDLLTDEIKDSFNSYLSKKLQYFNYVKYIDKNLELLFNALNNYIFVLSSNYFNLKKEILDYQVRLKIN